MAGTKTATKARKQALRQAPSVPMPSPFDDMERMFEAVFPRGWMRPFGWEHLLGQPGFEPMATAFPKVDVIDRDDEILVRAEIPGVTKEDLDVSVSDDSVTIKAVQQRDDKEERGDFYRREISHGSYARTLGLPVPVDAGKAKASFRDGVLELRLSKLPAAKKRHSIPVE